MTPRRGLVAALGCSVLLALVAATGAMVTGTRAEAGVAEPQPTATQQLPQPPPVTKRYITIYPVFQGNQVYPVDATALATAQLAETFDPSKPGTSCGVIHDPGRDGRVPWCDIIIPNEGDQFPLVVRLPGYVPIAMNVTKTYYWDPGFPGEMRFNLLRLTFDTLSGFSGEVIDQATLITPPGATVTLYVDGQARAAAIDEAGRWRIQPAEDDAPFEYRIVATAPGFTWAEVTGVAQPYSHTVVPDFVLKKKDADFEFGAYIYEYVITGPHELPVDATVTLQGKQYRQIYQGRTNNRGKLVIRVDVADEYVISINPVPGYGYRGNDVIVIPRGRGFTSRSYKVTPIE
jgi:hypothetical protein